MLEGAKLIGAGAATIALAGAAVGIGNVFSSSIHSVARNPSLAKQSFGYAILGFALTEAIASFAPMMALSFLVLPQDPLLLIRKIFFWGLARSLKRVVPFFPFPAATVAAGRLGWGIVLGDLDAESIKMMAPSGSDSGNWREYFNFQEYGEEASSAAKTGGPVQEPSGVLPAGEGTSGAGHAGSRSPLSSGSTHSWRLIESSPQPADPSHQPYHDVPEIPQENLWNELEQPLLSEIERKEQIRSRLLVHLPLENDSDHLDLEQAVETHFKVEIEVERHLRMEGFSPDSIRANLKKIRELILTTQKNNPRSQTELKRFLKEMAEDWRNSRPCKILHKARKQCSLFL